MRDIERRVGIAGAAVVGVAFGMGRFCFGLTLPDLRVDPGLSTTGVPDAVLGLIAGGTFAGFLAGIICAPLLAARRGPRAPTTVGGVCGALGALVVVLAPSPAVLAVGAVLAGSAAGWVWAPYSDLAAALVARERRPRLLSFISTGTCGGLVVVAVVAVAAAGGWRAVWAAVAVCSTAAALLNLRWVPAVPPTPVADRQPVPWRALRLPALYAVVYQAGTAVAFTYSADVATRAGLSAGVRPVLFVIIGVLGLAGLFTGAMTARIGPPRVAAGCLLTIAVSLVLLALGERSPVIALLAAAVFAAPYMVGAATLAVWTGSVVGSAPGQALSAAMVVGALGAVGAPVVVGALVTAVGLPVLLVAFAVLCGGVGAGLVRSRST
ncbi:MFS transporter [Actinomycetospora sp. NBRC 106378]|uniref:MFS transporter n=1 Tax=Actinomycetospora sp. NBRC 106378 TaxID=3032208 RepID=UPI0025542789|nr:MFS transporter [Actinomycetospora sp. NBRC 106378]